ncbi:centrosomal of 290 kDa-like, partial [Paramuricea clavata]
ARVTDLQEYVDILKSELEVTKKREKSRKRAQGTGMGGQSVEDMERVIAAMRRVVERLQTENDNLKKHPVTGQTQLNDLTKENKKLKHELNKLKQSHQASVKGTEKNSSKLATEHEKLRKDLTKEIENSKTLKIKMAGLENALNEKDDHIAQLEQRLQEAESRAPNLEGLDSKQWKSAVVTRMFEQKLKSMEGELEKKSNMLNDIKEHLRGSDDREEKLLKRQSELEEKIAILERFPTAIELDSDLVKEMQTM